ncbi:hypothetical protein [Actinoplanes sp. NPDC049118]|uniref:hypothetical protein n=1 Tax=Actinoplanes sp. NPDC049118 TaxID=3155769 RepID=UPI0033C2F1D9
MANPVDIGRSFSTIARMAVAVLLLTCVVSACGGGDSTQATITRYCRLLDGERQAQDDGTKVNPLICAQLKEQVPRSRLADFFPGREAGFIDSVQQFAVVGCGRRGFTSAKQEVEPETPPEAIADTRGKNAEDVLEACSETPKLNTVDRAGAQYTGLGTFAGSLPSASSVRCGSRPADPAAAGPPAFTTWSEYKYAKAYWEFVRRSAIALKEDDWNLASIPEKVYPQLEEDLAAAEAISFDEDAEISMLEAADAATRAEIAADHAAGQSRASGRDPVVAEHAKESTYWAKEAAAHASESSRYSDLAKKATNINDKAVYAAKADEEAKKAEEAAEKAVEAAEKATEAAEKKEQPAPEPDAPEKQPAPGAEIENTCEQVRRFMWECEQSGWRTGPCQEWLNKSRGCVDMSLINPGPDQGVVCSKPLIDAAAAKAAIIKACRSDIARPTEGGNFCRVMQPDGTLIVKYPAGCDPTVANEGCPGPLAPEGSKFVTPTIWCPEVPPNLPPLPCVEVGPPRPVK